MKLLAGLSVALILSGALHLTQCARVSAAKDAAFAWENRATEAEGKAKMNAAAVGLIHGELQVCLDKAADAAAGAQAARERLAQLDDALDRALQDRDRARQALYAIDREARDWAAQPVPEGIASQWRVTPEPPR